MRSGRVSPAAIAGWMGLAMLLGGAFLAALGGLNQTLYGAPAFIERYLGAIADDDIVSAAATPGVRLDAEELAAARPARGHVHRDVPLGRRRVRPRGRADRQRRRERRRLALGDRELPPRRRPSSRRRSRCGRSRRSTACSTGGSSRPARSPSSTSPPRTAPCSPSARSRSTRAHEAGDELAAFTQQAPYLAIAPAVYEFGYTSTLLEAVPTQVVDRAAARVAGHGRRPADRGVHRARAGEGRRVPHRPVRDPGGAAARRVPLRRRDRRPRRERARLDDGQAPRGHARAGRDGVRDAPTPGVARISVEVQSLFDGDFSTRTGPGVHARARRVRPPRRLDLDPAA